VHLSPVKSFAIAATQFMLILGLASNAAGNNNPAQSAQMLPASDSIRVIHGPSMPPDPWDVRVTHGPSMPPDPWDVRSAHGPSMPPDPWDLRAA
jgi:hypothetical protein